MNISWRETRSSASVAPAKHPRHLVLYRKTRRRKRKRKNTSERSRETANTVFAPTPPKPTSLGALYGSLSWYTHRYFHYLLVSCGQLSYHSSQTLVEIFSSHSDIHRVITLIGADNEAGPRLRARWEGRQRGRSQLTGAAQVDVGGRKRGCERHPPVGFSDGREVSYGFMILDTSRPESSVTWNGQPEQSARHAEQDQGQTVEFVPVWHWSCSSKMQLMEMGTKKKALIWQKKKKKVLTLKVVFEKGKLYIVCQTKEFGKLITLCIEIAKIDQNAMEDVCLLLHSTTHWKAFISTHHARDEIETLETWLFKTI